MDRVDAGQLGSWRRAVSTARTRVARSSRLPALLMGWPLRSLRPVSEALLGLRGAQQPHLGLDLGAQVGDGDGGVVAVQVSAALAAVSHWAARLTPRWPLILGGQ